ncbi:MAG: FumA C-terminus/TtdB family hydratase beta subunit [Dehalococcoidales bacterium]|nr:FumA C-terminus/TtdB family hydratase beta subunit [Dehalococcoidales bacterium]
MDALHITSPLDAATISKMHAGMAVLISGVIYTARDAAHKRIIQALDRNEPPPFDLKGQTIYYMGPSPARQGQVIGAAGPTTSSRMDKYALRLFAGGIRAVIGKGNRNPEVLAGLKQHQTVYFATTGGVGALLARSVRSAEVIAYADLGAEAVTRLEVVDFPAVVAGDCYGVDLYESNQRKYRKGR